jgi:hypothetical protein
VVSEIQKAQQGYFEYMLAVKKQNIAQLNQRLEIVEIYVKKFFLANPSKITLDSSHSASLLSNSRSITNFFEVTDLLRQIAELQAQLVQSQTSATSLVVPIYVSKVAVNKRPLFALTTSLTIGVFLGLLITLLSRILKSM